MWHTCTYRNNEKNVLGLLERARSFSSVTPTRREARLGCTEFWENDLWMSETNMQSYRPVFLDSEQPVHPSNMHLETTPTDEDDVVEISRKDETSVPVRRSARPHALRHHALRHHINHVISPAIQEVANILALDEHQPMLDEIHYRAFLAAGEQNPNDARSFEAKRKELTSKYENKVWDLVPSPPGQRVIGVSLAVYRQAASRSLHRGEGTSHRFGTLTTRRVGLSGNLCASIGDGVSSNAASIDHQIRHGVHSR